MKTTVSFALFLLIHSLSAQQTNPNCNHLKVEAIQMDNDTANLVKVTLSNNCSTCASGINGCLYRDLRIIKTVFPFDTLASSSCFCKWSPDNNCQKTYGIMSTAPSLPALNSIRVSLATWSCGCDTIPFGFATAIPSIELIDDAQIYPNPMHDFFEVMITKKNEHFIKVCDVGGRLVLFEKLNQSQTKVYINDLEKGFYFIEIMNSDNAIIKKSKIIKN